VWADLGRGEHPALGRFGEHREGGSAVNKRKTGEFIDLLGDLDFVAVQGHVDEEVFSEAVTGWEARSNYGPSEHAYARAVPVRDKDWDLEFQLSGRGRGAFKVTIAHAKGLGD
jgi:hypothetical protein